MHPSSRVNCQERRGILQHDMEASHRGLRKSLRGRLRMATNTSHLCVRASLPILLPDLGFAVTCFDSFISKHDTSRGLKSTCSLPILAALDSRAQPWKWRAQTSLPGSPHRETEATELCANKLLLFEVTKCWGSLLCSKVWLISLFPFKSYDMAYLHFLRVGVQVSSSQSHYL